MNVVGLSAALAAFLGIWIGHVAVRRVEAAAPRLWIPIVSAVGLGLGLEYASMLMTPPAASVAAGIVGITVLWDAIELHRQEGRIQRGHAPANLANPRHAHLLAAHPDATSVDLLQREPATMRSAAVGRER